METLTEIFKQTDPVEQILAFNNLTNSKILPCSLEETVSLLSQFYSECCKNSDFGFIIFEWIIGLYDGKWGYGCSNKHERSKQHDLLFETVLIESCRLNNTRLTKYLLQYGVRNNIENEKLRKLMGNKALCSSTALLHCIDNYNLELVKQMTALKITDDSVLIRSLCLGKHSIAEYLLQNGYTFPKKIEYEMLKNSYVFFTDRNWKATTSLAEASARANDVNILSILYSKELERNPSYVPVFIFDNMKIASMLDNLNVVKWLDEKLEEHKIVEITLETSIIDCIKNAARKNCGTVVEYLIKKYLNLAKKNAEFIKHESLRNSHSVLSKRIEEMLA